MPTILHGRDARSKRTPSEVRDSRLRPVCFWSPFVAACRGEIGHQIRTRVAAAIKSQMSPSPRSPNDLDEATMLACPSPERLVDLETFPRDFDYPTKPPLDPRTQAGPGYAFPDATIDRRPAAYGGGPPKPPLEGLARLPVAVVSEASRRMVKVVLKPLVTVPCTRTTFDANSEV